MAFSDTMIALSEKNNHKDKIAMSNELMTLTAQERNILFHIAFYSGVFTVDGYMHKSTHRLVQGGLVDLQQGRYVATKVGFDALSPIARIALQRPKNYAKLPENEQWAIDARLGILDWDGC